MASKTYTVTAESLAAAWWNRSGAQRVEWNEMPSFVQEGYVAETALWLTTAEGESRGAGPPIVTVTGTELTYLLRTLRDELRERQNAITALHVAVDEGTVKFKFNEGMWTVGYGG